MESGEDPWATIVGVVADTRQLDVTEEPEPAIYYDYRQRPGGSSRWWCTPACRWPRYWPISSPA
jgi:hypothetical protein